MLKGKQLFILLIVFLTGAGILWFYQAKVKSGEVASNLYSHLKNLPDHSLTQVKVGEKVYTLEVVNTPQSITQGLSDRALDEVKGDGMIFILPEKQVARFWMKKMQFPLDFYWLDAKGNVVGQTLNVLPPKPDQPLDSLPILTSPEPVWLVVEIPASGG